MKKIILLALFLSSLTTFSQNFKKARVKVNKLEFNTKQSEIATEVVDGKLLFFKNKKSYKARSKYYDLYMIDTLQLRKSKGHKLKVSLTDQIINNTLYHEGPACVDKVNNKIYITLSSLNKEELKAQRKDNGLKTNFFRLVEGDFIDGQISNLKEFPYNDPMYSVAHAAYSQETGRLYFSSTKPGGMGESDLYYCYRNNNGSWSKPISLGKRVNTGGKEIFPSVKYGVLFFTSNSQKKQTGTDLDIYYIPESKIGLMSPKPLPRAINSNQDDFLLIFDNNENAISGYFNSNRNNDFAQNDDIYRFTMTKVRFSKTYDMIVQITDGDKTMDRGMITVLLNDTTPFKKLELKGKEEVVFHRLKKGHQYTLKYDHENIKRNFKLKINEKRSIVRESLDIEEDAIFQNTIVVNTVEELAGKLSDKEKRRSGVKDVKLVEVVKEDPNTKIKDNAFKQDAVAKSEGPKLVEKKKTKKIRFDRKESYDNIYFDYDSYRITTASRRKLNKLLIYIANNNPKYIVVEAFTDSRGSAAYNERLSVKRALSCRNYLMRKGVDQDKILYSGFGESKLTNGCGDGVDCPESQHKMNRRIEFTLMY